MGQTIEKRMEWTFYYSGLVLEEACRSEIARRQERATRWQADAVKARQALAERGLATRTYDVTGGERSEVVLDPELAKRLSEAEAKARSHQENIRELTVWAGLFREASDSKFNLTFEDARYFGLHRELVEVVHLGAPGESGR